MKRRYGALTLEVPDDLEDETIVVLRGPALPSSAPLRMSRGDPIRPTFVVKRVPLKAEPLPLATLVQAERDMLEATIPGAQIEAASSHQLGAREAISFELRFVGPEGPLRQLHLSMMLGAWYLGFVATAPDGMAFEGVRERLLELAATTEVTD